MRAPHGFFRGRLALSGVLLALSAGCLAGRGSSEGTEGRADARRERPELVITREEVRELFGGREAKMLIHYPAPKLSFLRPRSEGPLYYVELSRDPSRLELLVEDAGTNLYGDPFISPDGSRVAFWKDGRIYVVYLRPGGPGRTEIGEGYDQRWWVHPRTGDEYLIWVDTPFSIWDDLAGTTWIRKIGKGTCTPDGPPLVLLPQYAFRGGRSVDGRYMCTALPGWALAELRPEAVEDAFVRIVCSGERMCNPSISQDPAHPTWFLWSPRRHGRVHYDPERPEAFIPPPPGYGSVQWAEWSTHPDFISASPSIRDDDTTPSAHDAWIYQWSTGKWTMVARRAYATHLWVSRDGPAAVPSPGRPDRTAGGPGLRPTVEGSPSWPSNRKGLLFKWGLGHEPAEAFGPGGSPLSKTFYRPAARGLALFDGRYSLRLEGGAFVAAELAEAALESARVSGEMSLELVVTPARTGAGRAGCVASLAETAERGNFFLSQRGRRLELALGGRGGESRGPVGLCEIAEGEPTHIVLVFSTAGTRLFRNGADVFASELKPDFAEWLPCPLVLGEPGAGAGTGGWKGLLEGVALYARALSKEEAAANAQARLALSRGRKPPPRAAVEARLLARSEVPPPADTVYERSYAMFEYEVKEVLSGGLPHCQAAQAGVSRGPTFGRIRVARWTEMGDIALAPSRARPGELHRLLLEPIDENPQLENEQVFDTLEADDELPCYYDAGPLEPAP